MECGGGFRDHRRLVRDYLASGLHESPLRYADEYYRHYPKIGLGLAAPGGCGDAEPELNW